MTAGQRLAAFVAWLATAPRNVGYRFTDSQDCAICKFGRAVTGGFRFDTSLGDKPRAPYVMSGGFNLIVSQGPFDSSAPLEFTSCFNLEVAVAFSKSRNLGELYDRLSAIIGKPVESRVPTDAEMEVIESRPLVPVTRRASS